MAAYRKKCSYKHTRPVGKKCTGHARHYPPEVDSGFSTIHTPQLAFTIPSVVTPTTTTVSMYASASTAHTWSATRPRTQSGAAGGYSPSPSPHAQPPPSAFLFPPNNHIAHNPPPTSRQVPPAPVVDLAAMQKMMTDTIERAMNPVNQEIKKMKEKMAESEGARVARDDSPLGPDVRRKAPADKTVRSVRQELEKLGLVDSSGEESDTTQPTTTDSEATPHRSRTNKRGKGEGKGKHFKSGRLLTAETRGRLKAPWPHFSIFKGPDLKGAEYDSLSLCEFICGYLTEMEKERCLPNVQDMTRYLKELMLDLKPRQGEWTTIRALHGVIMTMIQRKTLAWSDHEAISKQKVLCMDAVRAEKTTSARHEKQQTPCNAFNRGECDRPDSHNGALHVCAHCWEEKGRYHTHPKTACFTLVGNPAKKKGINGTSA